MFQNEYVTAFADEGSIGRSGHYFGRKKIISGLILDPTIRLEISSDQPNFINYENKTIYIHIIRL